MGSLSLFQWIFLTHESNWGLLHCRQILYQLSYEGSPSKEQESFIFMAALTITLILQPKKIKSFTASTFPPSICHEVMGLDAVILVFFFDFSFLNVEF